MTSNSSEKPPLESVLVAGEHDCNHTEAWEWVYSMQPAYMTVICVLGVLGNAFVLCVFCLHQRNRTVADIYLGNLAAADLLMVACLPFWITAVLNEFHWPFGEPMCQLVNIIISMNYYCSVLFLMLVSVDRYLVLSRPLSHGRHRRASWARGLCLGVWVLGALFSFPALLFRSVEFFPHLGVEACYMDYPHDGWRLRHNLTVNAVGFLLPVPVVSFCCFHILRVLQDQDNQMRSSRRSSRRRSSEAGAERKAAHLVLIVLLVFILCWLPYQVVILLDTLYYYEVISGCGWTDVLDISTQLSTYLGYSNSSLNPFLYVIVGKHFRQRARVAFRQLVCCPTRWSYNTVNLNSTIKDTDCTKV